MLEDDNSSNSSSTASTEDEETFREQYPTGWLAIAEHGSVAKIIDALLDLPVYREFNKKELAGIASVSRQSVSNHIDLLVGIGIVTEVEDTNPQRYRFNQESKVSEAVFQLEAAMNSAASPEHAES